MIQNINRILLILPIIISLSCERETEPRTVIIQLTAEDIGVTNAMLKVVLPAGIAPRTITLKRDTSNILTTELQAEDTLILDEGLLPKHSYTYTLTRNLLFEYEEKKTLAVTTMDTTSHNFTWEIDTLGDGNSSVLYDVAIVNDTLAYAVGEIYKRDSTGQFETDPYNAAKWDGKTWQLLRIKVLLNYGTSILYTYTRLTSVFVATPDDIWFVHYAGGVTRYKNGQWVMMNFPLTDGPGGANKVWGTSSDNLYFVADLGRITHHNGSSWQKLESGTTIDIKDIWGGVNAKLNTMEITCVASFGSQFPQAKKLLRIDGTSTSELSDSGLPLNLNSIWFVAGHQYYVTGSGIFKKQAIVSTTPWQSVYPGVPSYHTNIIRGNDINDVFLAGAFGEVLHFNGISWKSFRQQTTIVYGSYWGLSVKGNLCIAVGEDNPRAVIAIGKRH